ncbi:MAG TPA: response regulator transcription factor [Solirubrobacteraceae bacterium]|nr:response regulator transcription factor [Solirubrobacteraceae bacterium]
MNARLVHTAPSVGGDADSREATVLVVEASAPIGHELVEQLRADRYRAALARTAEHARSLARAQPIRAIVLGALDAPRAALDLLDEVRRPTVGEPAGGSVWDERLPAIVLSPGVAQLDLLRAFEMGADDFLAHPAPYLELRARLRAVLRRSESSHATPLLCAGPLEIDTGAHLVRIAGAPVELCRLEYELLVHLARNPATVCSKQELLRAVWGRRSGTGARTVDSHASRLRRKLDAAGARGLVVNVWGVGYRLV